MKRAGFYLGLVLVACLAPRALAAGQITPAMQTKIDAQIEAMQAWAADPIIVAVVRAQNAGAPDSFAGMTQAKWEALSAGDPFVQAFMTNPVASVLAARRSAMTSELFVNAADGRKVAFLAKTSSWSHAGSPKHDVPMTGKTWQGPVAHDHSSDVESVQISVPVLDGGTPIGSIVMGLAVAALK